MGQPTILMLGCFDTKGEDFAYLYQCLLDQEVKVVTINTGIRGTTKEFPVDFDAEAVAKAAGVSPDDLNQANDRSLVVEHMGKGASLIIARLLENQAIHGAIGMGGGGGTYIALSAMQTLPLGMPKLCISTVASKDLSRQAGIQDIILMPSIVDIAGLNQISRLKMAQGAAAICSMARTKVDHTPTVKGTIAISMFGNTTEGVDKCTQLLRTAGYEAVAFHAVGTGGQSMEALIREGFFAGVLDITTTELADELCGGILSAGPHRLSAAAEMGVPQVVAPGCLDMVNFGHLDTIPKKYQQRLLFSWAPDVTLMRTNEEENHQLGVTVAQKVSASKGPAAIIIPLQGISKVSSKGEMFHRPAYDHALFSAIKTNVQSNVPVLEVNAHINDQLFAKTTVNTLLAMIEA